MKLLDIHPDIRKFFTDLGYEIHEFEYLSMVGNFPTSSHSEMRDFILYKDNKYFTRLASGEYVSGYLLVPSKTLSYYVNNKKCTEEEMFKLIQLKEFW